MATDVTDQLDAARFEIHVDGELAGFVDYVLRGTEYTLPHTRILPAFEGRGLGSILVRGALDAIADRGGTVIPQCPFVPRVVREKPEYLALVPENRRAAYGL